MTEICDACGSIGTKGIDIGGAQICDECAPDVRVKMDGLREAGKPVNVRHIAKRIFREKYGTPGVLQIRDTPPELRARMDQAALDGGCTLRELVLKAVYTYLEG